MKVIIKKVYWILSNNINNNFIVDMNNTPSAFLFRSKVSKVSFYKKFLFYGHYFLINFLLIVTNLKNMENKKNREEKRKRRIDRTKEEGYRVIN